MRVEIDNKGRQVCLYTFDELAPEAKECALEDAGITFDWGDPLSDEELVAEIRSFGYVYTEDGTKYDVR